MYIYIHIHAYAWSDSGVYVYIYIYMLFNSSCSIFHAHRIQKNSMEWSPTLKLVIPTTGGPKGSSCPRSIHLSHEPCQILFSTCCFSMWQCASQGTHTDVFISLPTSLLGTKPRPRPSLSQKGAHLHQGPRSTAWTWTRWKI